MKKNTRKGFVLIEAMVVLAFLATTLLSIYTSFTNVLDNTKRRLYYDDPVYLYRTYYLLTYLEKNGLPEYINVKFINTSTLEKAKVNPSDPDEFIDVVPPDFVEFGCYSNYDDGESGGTGTVNQVSAKSPKFCEQIRNMFDIEHIYIMHYDVNYVIMCINNPTIDECVYNDGLKNFSNTAVNYLYTLDGFTTTDTSNANINRLKNPAYRNGYRIVVEFKKEKTIQYTYYSSKEDKNETKTTDVTKSDYYYATLEIPFGSTSDDGQTYHFDEM